jgi:hypothetical protein
MARHIYQGKFVDGNGAIIGGGTISVFLEDGTTAADVYEAESGGAVVNSVTSDTSNGTWSFFVDDASYSRNQKFKVTLSKTNYTTISYDDISVYPKVPSNTFYINDNETDQGAAGSGYSIKDIVDSVGSTNVTMIFSNMSGSATTTYTVSTSETVPANIRMVMEPGAILSIDSTKTLTVQGPFEAAISQCISGSGSILFSASNLKEIYPNWWGFSTSASAATNASAMNATLSVAFASGTDVYIPTGSYTCNSIAYTEALTDFVSGVRIYGASSAMQYDNNVSKSLLDFTGFSDTGSDVGLKIENTPVFAWSE